MKIISVDPSMNGVTGIISAEYDEDTGDVALTDFAIVDFRYNDYKYREQQELRLRKAVELIDWIVAEEPDLVICENFIMFKVQMGQFGQSFSTSELIGMITLECHKQKIPIRKPRSSEVRSPINDCRINDDGVKVCKPRKFKDNLTNAALIEKGYLGKVKGKGNAIHLFIGDVAYRLKDYQVGAKNDHAVMALRHLINFVESKNIVGIVDEERYIYSMSEYLNENHEEETDNGE